MDRRQSWRKTRPTTGPAWTRRLGSACLLALFVVASLVSGSTYLWCAPMQQAMHGCCCDAESMSEPDLVAQPGATLREPCCDSRHVAELTTGHVPTPMSGVPAALATGVDAPILVLGSPCASARHFVLPRPPAVARYGPTRAGPQSAAAACVVLQVFHC